MKRLLRNATVTALAAVLALMLATYLFGAHAIDRGLTGEPAVERVSAIVVLGAGQRANGTLGPASRARTLHAVALFQADVAETLIITGGSSRVPSTAQRMAELAVAEGVPLSQIIIEEQSLSTAQNALLSKPSAQGPIVLVTTRPHQLRAWVFFEWVGYDIAYTSAPEGGWKWLQYGYEIAAWAFNAVKVTLWTGAGLLGWSDAERMPLLN